MKAANFFTTKEAKFPCVPVSQFATYSTASLVCIQYSLSAAHAARAAKVFSGFTAL